MRSLAVVLIAFLASAQTFVPGHVFQAEPAHLVLWDFASGKALRTIRLPHSANHVAFSPDGRMVAVANLQGGVKLWRLSELLRR